MKSTKWLKKIQHLLSYNYFIKSIFSLITASLIVISNKEIFYAPLFFTSHFTIAFFVNILMIYQLISIVHNLTQVLDNVYPWHKSYGKRIPHQIFWGIFVPILPATLFAMLYFSFDGVNILTTIYFGRYLQQLITLLLILNICLYFHSKKKLLQKNQLQVSHMKH